MSSSTPSSFHPYHDPLIVTILIQSSFLLCLNIVNTLVDRLLFCGLLGQVFVGVAWGTAGAGWLSWDVEEVIVQLGYLGLILIVYEGGLSTNIRSVRANLMLSTLVAITGIAVPIGLSFTLQSILSATPLQAFAAGAALCSTSLGTTFTLLSGSGLASTRLGTVLSTAAMMDDVVGLVMVQVISNLGGGGEANGTSFDVATVLRPLGVSFGFVIFIPLACWGIVKPGTKVLERMRQRTRGGLLKKWVWYGSHTPFIIHTLVLLGLVAGASFAGTSNLLAAYLAGAVVSWWDLEHKGWTCESDIDAAATVGDTGGATTGAFDLHNSSPTQGISTAIHDNSNGSAVQLERENVKENAAITGSAVYDKYYAAAVQRILKPFFFASIGFAIPITQMFSGDIVWRGIIYTILMLFGKLVTGLWLVRFGIPKLNIKSSFRFLGKLKPSVFTLPSRFTRNKTSKTTEASKRAPQQQNATLELQSITQTAHNLNYHTKTENSVGRLPGEPTINQPEQGTLHDDDDVDDINPSNPPSSTPSSTQPQPQTQPQPLTPHQPQSPLQPNTSSSSSSSIPKPLSLYPASILGTAMTARGEIGFLIASIAESQGIFTPTASSTSSSSSTTTSSTQESSKLYLVVIWAIVLCTVCGPVGVGVLVRRVRRLRGGGGGEGGGSGTSGSGRGDPLGVWGVGRGVERGK